MKNVLCIDLRKKNSVCSEHMLEKIAKLCKTIWGGNFNWILDKIYVYVGLMLSSTYKHS